ncbi:MAG: hypothetical protein ACJ8NS_00785 [Chthoniobacterales bacterium]
MWWLSRQPALALLAVTGLLSPIVFSPATVSGQVNDNPENSSSQTLALNPERIVITLTNHLSQRPTSFDRAVEDIKDQIERRREAELEKSSQGAFWRARFWDYLPKSTGTTLNSPVADKDNDDPFFTPQYLTLSYRIVDRQLAESDARARVLFGR